MELKVQYDHIDFKIRMFSSLNLEFAFIEN